MFVFTSVSLFGFVNDLQRTSASRGSSRGKIAPMVSAGGSCVGMSALAIRYFRLSSKFLLIIF